MCLIVFLQGRPSKYDFISSPEHTQTRPEIVPRLDLTSITGNDADDNFEERAIDVQDLEGADDNYSERGIDVPAELRGRGVLHKRHSVASSTDQQHIENKSDKISNAEKVKNSDKLIKITKVPRKQPKNLDGAAKEPERVVSPSGRHFSPRSKLFSPVEQQKAAKRRVSDGSSLEAKSVASDQSKSTKSDPSQSTKSDQSKSSKSDQSKSNQSERSNPSANKYPVLPNKYPVSTTATTSKSSPITTKLSPQSSASPYDSPKVDTPKSIANPQDIAIDFDTKGDLLDMKLPGLKMRPGSASGLLLRGSEHLHPALERSLRSPAVPRRPPTADDGVVAAGNGNQPMSKGTVGHVGKSLLGDKHYVFV